MWLRAPLGEHLVLADPPSGRVFLLDPLACLVWEAQAEGIDPEETAELLAERFGQSAQAVLSDVRALLQSLSDAAITPSPGGRDDGTELGGGRCSLKGRGRAGERGPRGVPRARTRPREPYGMGPAAW